MDERDKRKIMLAGFVLYRCSEGELIVKRRSANDASWKIKSRHKTKKAVKDRHYELLKDPKAIQD